MTTDASTDTRRSPQRRDVVPPAPAVVPGGTKTTRQLVETAFRDTPPAPDPRPKHHRLLPRALRDTMTTLGLWQEPAPQRPSAHLEQTLNVLRRYGWAQNFDFSPTGRMCIRGAQTYLEHGGHVTPVDRGKAVHYMQSVLTGAGITEPFHLWNDSPQRTFPQVSTLIIRSAQLAREHGE